MHAHTLEARGQDSLRRGVSVGSSTDSDATVAGNEAALSATGGARAKLLVVLASSELDPRAVIRGVRAASPESPLIGCTSAGEIVSGGTTANGVVVLALTGDGFDVATGVGPVIDGDLRTAAADASSCAERIERRENTVLLLLSDGLAGDQQEVVRGAYQQVGALVPLVGGCAGDEGHMVGTHQFHGRGVQGNADVHSNADVHGNADVYSNAVVAAAISSDGPIGIGVSHGWRPVGEPMSVTYAEGVVVRELEGRPALDVYLERLDAPDSLWEEPGSFTEFASTRPLGMVRRGRAEIRFVATADYAERSLSCFAEIPQGGLCWLMDGDARSILDATDEACTASLEPLEGTEPLGLLAFDCIARKGVLGRDGVVEETERIANRCGPAAVAGFYTYGEFARLEGATGFHNQTLVVLAFG